MPGRNVIEIVVSVTDQATRQLSGIERQVQGIAQRIPGLRSALGGLGIAAVMHTLVRQSSEAQATLAQLESAFRATGATAGVTREQLSQLAKEMQQTTTYSATAARQAQVQLLTFDKVRGDVLRRTTVASADLAARLGTDLVSATRTLGLALQDPATAMMRLRRAGIAFSEQQRETIRGFLETGETAKAQAVVLREIERVYGGAAAAAKNTLGGALASLRNAFNDLFEVDAGEMRPVIDAINLLAANLGTLAKAAIAAAGAYATLRAVVFVGDTIDAVHGWVNLFSAVASGRAILLDNVAVQAQQAMAARAAAAAATQAAVAEVARLNAVLAVNKATQAAVLNDATRAVNARAVAAVTRNVAGTEAALATATAALTAAQTAQQAAAGKGVVAAIAQRQAAHAVAVAEAEQTAATLATTRALQARNIASQQAILSDVVRAANAKAVATAARNVAGSQAAVAAAEAAHAAAAAKVASTAAAAGVATAGLASTATRLAGALHLLFGRMLPFIANPITGAIAAAAAAFGVFTLAVRRAGAENATLGETARASAQLIAEVFIRIGGRIREATKGWTDYVANQLRALVPVAQEVTDKVLDAIGKIPSVRAVLAAAEAVSDRVEENRRKPAGPLTRPRVGERTRGVISPLGQELLEKYEPELVKARREYDLAKSELEKILKRAPAGSATALQAQQALTEATRQYHETLKKIAGESDKIKAPDVVGAIFDKIQGQAEAARSVMEGLRSDIERQREELTEQIATLEKFRATYASLSEEELVTLGVDSREVELAGRRVDELRAKLAQVPQTQAIADGIEVIRSLRTETELLAETMAEQQAKLAALLAVLVQQPEKNADAIRAVMDAQAEVARRTTEQMKELQKQSNESSAAARRAAEQIQDAFANAFRSLSRFEKPRDILRGFLEAIREIPIQIAAEKIGEKIRESLKLDELFDKLLGGGAPKPAIAGGAGAAAATVLGAVLGGAPAGAQAQAATAVAVTTPVSTTQAATAVLNTATVTAASLPATAAIAKVTAATASLSAAMCQANIKSMVVNASNVVVTGGGGEGGDLLGSVVSGLTGGLFKAGGGATPKGRAVLVGEEGPEVIVPSADAQVYNQRQLQFAAGALRMVEQAERVPRDEVILPAQQSMVVNQRQMAFRQIQLAGIGGSAGGGLIPANRPRLVHAGEMILPAQQQQALMAGAGGNINFSPINNITVQGTGNAREDQERMAEILELNNARQMERFAKIMERNGFGRLRA